MSLIDKLARLIYESKTYTNGVDNYDLKDLKIGDTINNITDEQDAYMVTAKIIAELSNQPIFNVSIVASKSPRYRVGDVYTWDGEALYNRHSSS